MPLPPGHAGIVADHMDAPERRVCCLGGPIDARRIGNVASDAAHIRSDAAQAFDGTRQRVRLDIGEHHFHARPRKGPAERKPDAARPARHERCLTGELAHGSPRCVCNVTEARRARPSRRLSEGLDNRFVMRGLDPRIHVWRGSKTRVVDARPKAEHDRVWTTLPATGRVDFGDPLRDWGRCSARTSR